MSFPFAAAAATPQQGTPAAQSQTHTRNTILSEFTNQLYRLLDMLANQVFPDCARLRAQFDLFKGTVLPSAEVQRFLCTGWHNSMKQYYDACTQGNPEPFFQGRIELLEKIGFREKYQELTDPELYSPAEIEANIKNLWPYINAVNKFARLYNQIPRNVAVRLETAASDLIEEINNGKSMSEINWLQVGQRTLRNVTKDDVLGLMENMAELAELSNNDMHESLGVSSQLKPFLDMMRNMGRGADPETAARDAGMTVDQIDELRQCSSEEGGVDRVTDPSATATAEWYTE